VMLNDYDKNLGATSGGSTVLVFPSLCITALNHT
jgi:hypothetical protein